VVKAVNLVTDEERELRFSTTNSASSYGIPVLVDVESGDSRATPLPKLEQWGFV